MTLIIEWYVQISMALIIELYGMDLYGTNYWIVCDGIVCH